MSRLLSCGFQPRTLGFLEQNCTFIPLSSILKGSSCFHTCASAICSVSQGFAGGEKIVIPECKKRDEYSILRALASTVKNDLSAPHYKFNDDPFLIPSSNLDKRIYALSKVSGQKAARYVINRYPGNFAYDTAEPSIEMFIPPTGFKFSDTSIEGLQERINQKKSIAAFECYHKILDSGLVVPTETVEDLLELLCFYNSNDPPENPLSDELFLRREVSQDNTKKIRKEWKDEGAAEMLFKNIKEPSIRAYSSIIRGRAKYYQMEKAFETFKHLREKGVKFDVNTYNAVLPASLFLQDWAEARWEIIQELLRDMASNEVTPDINTFNAVLFVLSRCSRSAESRLWFTQTINEMKSLNIEPTLTSWSHGLQLFYHNDSTENHYLYEVIKYLKEKPLSLRECTDYEFFSVAMVKCFSNLKDLDLAYDIDHLLNSNHTGFLGDSFREGLYYTHFLRLLCMYEQLDELMKIYDHLIPHKYTPTFTVMQELFTTIELNEGYAHLPKLWSDMVLFQYTKRTDLMERLLNLMATKKQNSELQDLFVKIVKNIKKQAESDSGNLQMAKQIILTGKMIGDMSLVMLNADDIKSAWDVMQYFIQNRHHINNFPSEQSLVFLAEVLIKSGDVDKTMQCLSLISDFGYPVLDQLVDKVKASMKLTNHQKNQLDNLL